MVLNYGNGDNAKVVNPGVMRKSGSCVVMNNKFVGGMPSCRSMSSSPSLSRRVKGNTIPRSSTSSHDFAHL